MRRAWGGACEGVAVCVAPLIHFVLLPPRPCCCLPGDCTPLMEAASGGYADIVSLLLDHGAEVNAKSAAGEFRGRAREGRGGEGKEGRRGGGEGECLGVARERGSGEGEW